MLHANCGKTTESVYYTLGPMSAHASQAFSKYSVPMCNHAQIANCDRSGYARIFSWMHFVNTLCPRIFSIFYASRHCVND